MNAGYKVSVATADASSHDDVHALAETATSLGDVTGLIHAAGVSPTQASLATTLKVDLYGTALVLEEFGDVIARGGSGVVISSQSGHRLPPLPVEQSRALTTTPVEELLGLGRRRDRRLLVRRPRRSADTAVTHGRPRARSGCSGTTENPVHNPTSDWVYFGAYSRRFKSGRPD